MQINRKALYASLLVSLPAPLLLALLLMGTDATVFLASGAGLIAYLVSYALFVVVALIASSLAAISPHAAKATGGQKRSSGKVRKDQPAGDLEEGEVKWFNVKKGFGFIVRDSGGDVFVHFRAIEGNGRRVLRQGQRVSFRVVEADKGLQANDVTPLDEGDE